MTGMEGARCLRERQIGAGHLRHFSVHNDGIDCREPSDGLEGFVDAVGGQDVEFSGFDDEFAGGNASRVLAVHDQKAWAMRSIHR